jgi:hypothetical protein
VASVGGRVAYGAHDGKNAFVVCDGTIGPSYERVWDPVFPLRGERLAYKARRRDESGILIVVDGAEEGPFEGVENPVFGPGAAMAIIYSKGGRYMVRSGETAFGPFEAILHPTFTDDGALVFAFEEEGKRRIHAGGSPAKASYDEITALQVRPSTAFLARRDQDRFVVCRGKEQAPFDRVDDLCVSPFGTYAYRARQGKRWHLVSGTHVSRGFDAVGAPVSATDRPAFSAWVVEGSRAYRLTI